MLLNLKDFEEHILDETGVESFESPDLLVTTIGHDGDITVLQCDEKKRSFVPVVCLRTDGMFSDFRNITPVFSNGRFTKWF